MLSLLSSIYGKAMALRNGLYDKGLFETHDLGARTISIGNITTGGTGKTPLVAYVAEKLAERGETVCILTRGYGRKDSKKRVLVSDGSTILSDPANSGDEPFELAQKLLRKAIIIIADADRVAAAEWAKRKFGVTAFVLDDGFQHRQAKRDLDIVCVDATNPTGDGQAGSLRSGRVLPAGRLREPLLDLGRADVVVITRADLVDDISNLRSEILDLNSEAAIFTAMTNIVNAVEFRGKRGFAFCGLGNPDGFYKQLQREGIDVVGTKTFADHHQYTQKEVNVIEAEARECEAEVLLTTAKDDVKLSDLKFEVPRQVVRIGVEIDDPTAFGALL